MEFAQAFQFTQKFRETGVLLKITSKLNGKRKIMGPCPYCYFELTDYNRTAEPTDMPGYHRVIPPIKFDLNPTDGQYYGTLNLECDKRKDMGFVLERGVMQRLLAREGIIWGEVRGGF